MKAVETLKIYRLIHSVTSNHGRTYNERSLLSHINTSFEYGKYILNKMDTDKSLMGMLSLIRCRHTTYITGEPETIIKLANQWWNETHPKPNRQRVVNGLISIDELSHTVDGKGWV